jgi:ribosomal protein L40E
MSSYKICPSCGHQNPKNLIECSECEYDLQNVVPTDPDAPVIQEPEVESSTTENTFARICPECHHENPAQSRKCEKCGEEIFDVIPSLHGAEKKFTLELFDGNDGATFSLEDTVTDIGREAKMALQLATKTFVSRVHIRLTKQNEELFIQNLSTTNGTFVNGVRITDDNPHMLKVGDEIGLGGNASNGNYQPEAAYLLVKEGNT